MLASRTDRSPRRRWRLPGASPEVRREQERNLELLGTQPSAFVEFFRLTLGMTPKAWVSALQGQNSRIVPKYI